MSWCNILSARYFFNCLLAQINKEMQESNLANNDTLHQIAQGRYNMGTIAENEVLNMELNYLNSLSQLETAKLELENQMFYLKSYLRIKDEYDIELIPPANIPNLVIDANEAVAEANANRADIISYQRQIMEAEQNLDAAKKNRFSANIAMTFGLDKSSHSIDDVYHDPQNKEVIMLGINVPILDWGKAKGQIKMAESSLELTRTTIEQEEIDFNQEIYIKAKEFNIQQSQLMIAAKSDTVAQKRYDFTKARYLIGTIDITELNSAAADKDSKRQGYISALQNYWINYFEIRKLTLYDFEKKQKLSSEFDAIIE